MGFPLYQPASQWENDSRVSASQIRSVSCVKAFNPQFQGAVDVQDVMACAVTTSQAHIHIFITWWRCLKACGKSWEREPVTPSWGQKQQKLHSNYFANMPPKAEGWSKEDGVFDVFVWLSSDGCGHSFQHVPLVCFASVKSTNWINWTTLNDDTTWYNYSKPSVFLVFILGTRSFQGLALQLWKEEIKGK